MASCAAQQSSDLPRPAPGGSRPGRSAAPVCQELVDERVLVAGFDGEWRQCERHSKRRVIAERSRRNGTRVRRMRIVDPNGAVD